MLATTRGSGSWRLMNSTATRAETSLPPPGGKATTSCTGFFGICPGCCGRRKCQQQYNRQENVFHESLLEHGLYRHAALCRKAVFSNRPAQPRRRRASMAALPRHRGLRGLNFEKRPLVVHCRGRLTCNAAQINTNFASERTFTAEPGPRRFFGSGLSAAAKAGNRPGQSALWRLIRRHPG